MPLDHNATLIFRELLRRFDSTWIPLLWHESQLLGLFQFTIGTRKSQSGLNGNKNSNKISNPDIKEMSKFKI
jgi:hypothetical protein